MCDDLFIPDDDDDDDVCFGGGDGFGPGTSHIEVVVESRSFFRASRSTLLSRLRGALLAPPLAIERWRSF